MFFKKKAPKPADAPKKPVETQKVLSETDQRLHDKEGKIKKAKPLVEITEDEVPFEIPENWKWVRFADLYVLSKGLQVVTLPAVLNIQYFGSLIYQTISLTQIIFAPFL